MAFSLFLSWDFSSWHETTSPVGRWVMRTAESVVFTLGRRGRWSGTRRCADRSGSISMSTSSASGSTATVAVEVWMRPCGLGRRDPLHPVDAAFILEAAVGASARAP